MYSFCRDIRFLEQLEESKKGFENNIFIALVDNKAFYRGNSEPEKIYSYFRDKKPLTGPIDRPTETKNIKAKYYTLKGCYHVNWRPLNNSLQYWIQNIKSN